MQSRFTALATTECFDFAIWTAAGSSNAWENGAAVDRPLLQTKSASETAASMLHSFADGGYVDNTGIAWLVSAGQTSITAFLDSFNNVEFLFGRPQDLPPPLNFESFKIFADPWEEIHNRSLQFTQFAIPPGGSFLKEISYAVIDTETVDNPWFGIAAGSRITLNVLNIYCYDNVSIGFTNNYYYYSGFVGEVIDAMLSPTNSDHMKIISKQFFGL